MADLKDEDKILVAGAGPTGLVFALWMAHQGLPIRIIDKNLQAGTTSRALVLHARTLEFYDQLGIAKEILKQGIKFEAANFWVRGKRKVHFQFGEFGKGVSPFPFMFIFPQDEHERFLINELKKFGVEIERGTELLGFAEMPSGNVRLKKINQPEERANFRFIIGCDGAHSQVRHELGIGFTGTTDTRVFYVADVVAEGPIEDKELHVGLDSADLLAAFPLKGLRRTRFVGSLNESWLQNSGIPENHEWSWADIAQRPLDELDIHVKEVNWFSSYRVHHRVAERFRMGNYFLLGDAAHVHSPIGGQGMNTGIGDAINLAWKVAAVIKKKNHEKILETYEPERIAFARKLVKTTDRAFTLVSHGGLGARIFRLHILPKILSLLFRLKFFPKYMFKVVSQTAIAYPQSPLSAGRAGTLRGGDRLPWTGENFESLKKMEWQIHVYGTALNDVDYLAKETGMSSHVFPWRPAMLKMGLKENTICVVRPDGYVAFAASSPQRIREYFKAASIYLSSVPIF